MNRSDQCTGGPNPKRPKTDASTSSKSKVNDDCPILMLPPDILAKVITFIPVAQWAALELLYDFRPATLIAWRQLRNINVDRQFLIKPTDDESSFGACIKSILQKLTEHSPFLSSISGIDVQFEDEELISNFVHLLAKFEHLQSITLGDRQGGIRLEDVVEFLEMTRSRTSLKELKLFDIDQSNNRDMYIEEFASSLVSGREIRSPLKLETFSFTSNNRSLYIRLDTMDTTRLTALRLGTASIEPQQLIRLIERTPSLRQIEFMFMHCDVDEDDEDEDECDGPRLQANKKLLLALKNHENLTATKFDCAGYQDICKCMHFELEFIQMLKAIGRRGQLQKLAMGERFVFSSNIDVSEVCAAIRDYLPYLRSIKLQADRISDENVSDIVSLAKLEEIDLSTDSHTQITTDVVKKIASLTRLKRLGIDGFYGDDMDSWKCLAAASTLKDLRIRKANMISADDFEKWSEGFASNLRIFMLDRFGGDDSEDNEGDDHAEAGLVRLLEKATRLRVLILDGRITDRSLKAIAESCPELEILGVNSYSEEITIQHVQEVIDRCPNLKRLGGIDEDIQNELQFPKYRNIGDVDIKFWNHDFDSGEYD